MSTSLLYHGFGIRDYQYVRTDYEGGEVCFTAEQRFQKCRCAGCGSRKVQRRPVVTRRFRMLPIGGKRVTLEARLARVACQECGVIRQAPIDFADSRRSYTRSFARYVLELSRHMTIKDVADHLGVSWDLVKEIQKIHLQKHFARPKLKHLKQIAIDEISVGRGHQYITLVLVFCFAEAVDLQSGAVDFVGEGKGADALLPFWHRLRSSGAKVDAVATDMSPAYIEAVTTHLSNATHVFDRFHVMKL